MQRVKIETEDKRWLWLSAQIENPAFTVGEVPKGVIGDFGKDICAKHLRVQMLKRTMGNRWPIVFELRSDQSQNEDEDKVLLKGNKWSAEVYFMERERYWRVILSKNE